MKVKEEQSQIRQILANNIKKRRESLGMTQEKLAEITDLSVQTINTLEGCRMWISDKSITRLAQALDVEIFQLFMPNYINTKKFDTKYIDVLLEFWQKAKLAVDKIDDQIDYEFQETLKYHNIPKNNERINARKPDFIDRPPIKDKLTR